VRRLLDYEREREREKSLVRDTNWPKVLYKKAYQAADAFDYLHDHNHKGRKRTIIHCDIKCANLLLFTNGSIKGKISVVQDTPAFAWIASSRLKLPPRV
jgi:serine/threonine protein kinase